MAVYRNDIINIDLETGTISRGYLNHQIGEGDIAGDRFGVRVLRNGAAADLTGVTCVGYFTRTNGTTVEITGSRSGNTMYVQLPKACYVYEGNFSLAIKAVETGRTSTVRIVEGTVINTTLSAIVDPASAIPDLSDFEELISDAQTAAATINGFSITETQISGTRYKLTVTLPS